MPKVSVIIPVYNVEKYLRQCLDSVINQTLTDIEIICVDDGSTDSSLAILEEYASKDDRIKILKQQNAGAGVARNNGIKVATGEYLHFLDSDDWIENDTYEKLYNLIAEKQCDFVKFKSYSYDDVSQEIVDQFFTNIGYLSEEKFNKFYNFEKDYKTLILVSDAPWSGFYNTKFIKENNIYFDNLICANDVSFYYRCLVNAKNIYISDQRFVYYRINNSTSLIGIRAYNFDCQLKLYKNISEIIKPIKREISEHILSHICDSIFTRRKLYLRNKGLPDKAKLKIIKQLADFAPNLNVEPRSKEHKKMYKYVKNNSFKYYLYSYKYLKIFRILENVFCIRNSNNKKHKILTILGVKFSFRRKKYA